MVGGSLGVEPNMTGVLNIILHPIVVILGFQCLILCTLLGICIWSRKHFLKQQADRLCSLLCVGRALSLYSTSVRERGGSDTEIAGRDESYG